jgi:hypothetical protein
MMNRRRLREKVEKDSTRNEKKIERVAGSWLSEEQEEN